MDAEDIVRALAAEEYPDDRDYGVCVLCGAPPEMRTNEVVEHRPTCPWRMAREWVEANDGPPGESVFVAIPAEERTWEVTGPDGEVIASGVGITQGADGTWRPTR